LVSVAKFEKISVIISWRTFSVMHSSSSNYGTLIAALLTLVFVSHTSLRICSFFHSIFSLLFRLSNFYFSIIKLAVNWFFPLTLLHTAI
jgi:hypothetical protein